MTERLTSYLCVGGPYDGRRIDAQGRSFLAFIELPASLTPPEANDKANVEHVRYVREIIDFRGGDSIEFWRPDGQSMLETLIMLLETYESACRRGVS